MKPNDRSTAPFRPYSSCQSTMPVASSSHQRAAGSPQRQAATTVALRPATVAPWVPVRA